MRWNGNVINAAPLKYESGANKSCLVFRAAHDSSKMMRTWMGELKKKT